MSTASAQQKRLRTHAAKWELLCARYLPISSDSIWRYNRFSNSDDPEQGWKLHISATILSANKTFARVAPYLRETNVMFKAPCSLEELEKLNNGLFYGYSQVGKFITVYPRNASEAVSLAIELDRLTTGLPPCPLIPFDSRFGPDSAVYYRYGSFALQMADGSSDAIRTPEGEIIEDSRTNGEAKPKWVVDPFPRRPIPSSNQDLSNKSLQVIGALSQRGKGGVYDAIDFSVAPPRRCIIKQGRSEGEVSWDGKDGAWMVRHETRISERLAKAGIEVPLTYAKFRIQKNYYVVMEHIEGETLQAFLEKRQRRLPIRQVLDFIKQIASLLARIHRAGWLWLDCKPANLMLTPSGKLRPLDFEGACLIRRPVSLHWQTPAFAPRDCGNNDELLSPSKDIYAFGVTCYFLLTGRLPDASGKTRLSRFRRHVPKQLQNVVELLLDPDPLVRPRAEEVNLLLASC